MVFFNDGLPIQSAEFFRLAMDYAWGQGRWIIHCEELSMNPGVSMNEGLVSRRQGMTAQPDVAEAAQVAARDILLVDYRNDPVQLAHVSCRCSVKLAGQGGAHFFAWEKGMRGWGFAPSKERQEAEVPEDTALHVTSNDPARGPGGMHEPAAQGRRRILQDHHAQRL